MQKQLNDAIIYKNNQEVHLFLNYTNFLLNKKSDICIAPTLDHTFSVLKLKGEILTALPLLLFICQCVLSVNNHLG